MLGCIERFWLERGCIVWLQQNHQGYESLGNTCGQPRVLRPMKSAKLRVQRGYRRQSNYKSDVFPMLANNCLKHEFLVSKTNTDWVTDITYIRIQEGWLFLAVVLDFFSRSVIGWSMSARINTKFSLNALPWHAGGERTTCVAVHSDQSCRYTSYDRRNILKANGLKAGMSRRGHRHDNACAESFLRFSKRSVSDTEFTRQKNCKKWCV